MFTGLEKVVKRASEIFVNKECEGKHSILEKEEPIVYICDLNKKACEYAIKSPLYEKPLCHYNLKNKL